MDLHASHSGIGQLILAAHALEATLLGGVIGWQREHVGREAGVRTFGAVAMGACLFGLVSAGADDSFRIAAQVVTGIGFLGAGIILKDAGHVIGLTTAASLWATAAIGLLVWRDLHVLAVASTILLLLLLSAPVKDWERRLGIAKSPAHPDEPPLRS